MTSKYSKIVVPIALLCLAAATHYVSSSTGPARLLHQVHSLSTNSTRRCEPWSVPAEQRCEYVKEHKAVCYPDGGTLSYLKVHYCVFGNVQTFSCLLIAIFVLLLFGVSLTASSQFFCPSLAIIADYLRLPASVAGATLLSFGNGAPDIFTQLAAVKSVRHTFATAVGTPNSPQPCPSSVPVTLAYSAHAWHAATNHPGNMLVP